MNQRKSAALMATAMLIATGGLQAYAADYTSTVTDNTAWITNESTVPDANAGDTVIVTPSITDTVTVQGAALTIYDPVNLQGGLIVAGNADSTKGSVQVNGSEDSRTTINGLWLQDDANAGIAQGNTFSGTNVTFTGDQLAVDASGKFVLNGGTIDVAEDAFTTEGGVINVANGEVYSGVWVSSICTDAQNLKYGAALFTNTTFGGGNLVVQGAGAGLMLNASTANVNNIAAWDKVLVGVQADSLGELYNQDPSTPTEGGIYADRYAGASGSPQLTIYNNSNVTTENLYLQGLGSLVVGTNPAQASSAVDTSSLTITKNAVIDGASSLYVYAGSAVTFSSGSSLSVQGDGVIGSVGGQPVTVYPGLYVKNEGTLTFEAGSAAYSTAKDDGTVRTLIYADEGSTINVDENASLYITNAESGKTYNLSKVIQPTGNDVQSQDLGQSWTGQIFGSSQRIKIDTATGLATQYTFGETYGPLLAANAMEAAADGNGKAADFISSVESAYRTGKAAEGNANITTALNSSAGLTGLAGIGYGLASFSDTLSRSVNTHDAADGNVWASYIHDKRTVDGLKVGNLDADYDLTYNGAVIGVDFSNTDTTRYGLALAYANGDVSTNGGAVSTQNDADYYGGSLYGVWNGAKGLTYKAELGYTKSSNDLTQYNTGTKITASTDADAVYAGVRAEKAIESASGTWTPYAGLRYTRLAVDDYTDSLGFAHNSDNAGIWNLPVGVAYSHESKSSSGWTYTPSVELGYQFAFGNKTMDETVSFGAGSDLFGVDIAENSFLGRLSFTASNDDLAFGVHYCYQKGSNTDSKAWGVSAGLKF